LIVVIVCLDFLCTRKEKGEKTQVSLSESSGNSGTNRKLVKRGIFAKTIDSSEMKILKKILFGPTEASGLWKLNTTRRS